MSDGYFPKEEIVKIHDNMIGLYGGIYGIRDMGLLDQCCVAPYGEFGGIEFFPTIIEKAAKYLECFATYQIFLDGNKRTAAAVMLLVLKDCGIKVKFDPQDLENFVRSVANGKHDFSSIVSYIRDHVV